MVHRHCLGEDAKLSVPEISAVSRKWKITGTMQVKARGGGPRKLRKQKRSSSKDPQHDVAADGATVHHSTTQGTVHKEMLDGRVTQKMPLVSTRHKQSLGEKLLLPRVKFGRGSFMLWGCVASTHPGNLVEVECHVVSSQYQQVLELKFCWGWILQQDNEPRHYSKSTKAFMQREKCSVLDHLSPRPE